MSVRLVYWVEMLYCVTRQFYLNEHQRIRAIGGNELK